MNMENIKKWKHVMKLDPDKKISEKNLEKIIVSGSDALMVSGTQNVTRRKVEKILGMIKKYDIPKVLEPPHPDCIVDGFDYVFVPCVINSDETMWVVDKHKEWIEKYDINWEIVVPEAYIVLNPDSMVGKVTKAKTNIEKKEIVAYAVCAEKFFNFPIVYIEYSGKYGDPEIVRAVHKSLEKSLLFYGGGINSREKASEMAKYADTIVVGNAAYEDINRAVETVLRSITRA